MKSVAGLIAGFAWAVAPAVQAADYQLITKCRALLAVISADPADKGITLESESQRFAPTVAGFGRSQVMLTVGEYTVRGSMQMNGPFGDPEVQPRLVASLVKGGNPVTGQVNYSNVGGIDLDSRPVGIPLSVTSMAFITAQVQGRKVSRIDFSCSVTKLK